MMRRLTGMILGILFACGVVFADTTWVAGGLDVSGDWSASGSPYMILGHINVAQMDTLRIGPDVTLFFQGPFRLTVAGTLTCRGLSGEPVLFTTDTVENPGGWGGIRLIAARGTCRFDYTVIEYGHSLGSSEFSFGGGLYADATTVEMNDCTVRACRALAGQGIYCKNGSLFTLNHCVIRDNGLAFGSGGGAYVRGGSTAFFSDCDFTNNSSGYGAAATVDGSTATFIGCRIQKNDAVNSGGGLYCAYAVVTLSRCTFLANTSMGGGAVDGRNDVNLTMDHCLIESNVAMRQGAEGLGGGLALAGGSQHITNCTFVNNGAGTGGAVYAGNNTRIENCIFGFQVHGGGVYFPLQGATLHYCCLAYNAEGNFNGPFSPIGLGLINHQNVNGDSCDGFFNLYRDPMFDPAMVPPYLLMPESPCINAGSPLLPHDPDGSLSDIGAFYYDPASVGDGPVQLPSTFCLAAYPNPFNPSTSLAFTLSREMKVTLKIYDITGREAATLLNARRPAGSYTFTWNAAALPSGAYFAVLESEHARAVQKLLLLK